MGHDGAWQAMVGHDAYGGAPVEAHHGPCPSQLAGGGTGSGRHGLAWASRNVRVGSWCSRCRHGSCRPHFSQICAVEQSPPSYPHSRLLQFVSHLPSPKLTSRHAISGLRFARFCCWHSSLHEVQKMRTPQSSQSVDQAQVSRLELVAGSRGSSQTPTVPPRLLHSFEQRRRGWR